MFESATIALVVAACVEASGLRQPVAAIELTPVPQLWVGDSRPLAITLRAADGSALHDRAIAWTSDNDSVATVDAAGVLSTHAVGSTTIGATSEGIHDEIPIVVFDLDLIYQGFLGGSPEMLVLPLRDGQPTRVLSSGAVISRPVPSPDGTKIAFVAATTEKPDADIYVVNRDGTGLARLTDAIEIDENPAWSPDGTRIAFRSFRAGRQGDIWVMNADGSNPVNLTPDPLTAAFDDRRPAWSPDGKFLAFASNRAGTLDIWTMRADGTQLAQITSTRDYDTEPSWSPVGDQIAFRRSNDALSDIWLVGLRGGAAVRLSEPGHELMPAWSPNGRYIAYAHFGFDSPVPQIYTVRPDGSERTLRTTDPNWNGGIEPGWIRK